MRYVKNLAIDGSFDGKANASNHVYLNGTDQSVDLPVIHDITSTQNWVLNIPYISGEPYNGVLHTVPAGNSYGKIIDGSKIYIKFEPIEPIRNGYIIARSAYSGVINRWFVEYIDGDLKFTSTQKTVTFPFSKEITIEKIGGKLYINGTDYGAMDDILESNGITAFSLGCYPQSNGITPQPNLQANIMVLEAELNGETWDFTTSGDDSVFIGSNGTELLRFDSTGQKSITIGVITIPANSNLSFYDVTTKTFKQSTSTEIPVSSVFTMTTSFSQYFTHTKSLTVNELAELTANSNKIYDVWFNSATLVDGFAKTDMVNFVPGNEGLVGGSDLYDLSDASLIPIANYTDACRTTYQNVDYGATNLLLEQDSSGITTGVTPPYTIDVTSGDVDTTVRPNLPVYTIEEVVELADGTTEARVLIHDTADKYFINGVEQVTVPSLPDPNTNMKLDSTALIGNPDTINKEKRDFRFWSVAKDPNTTVPRVLHSVITPAQNDGIEVTWDRHMMTTCDVKSQIKVIVDGAEFAPQSVEFHPTDKTKMGLIMANPFTPGQTVTWAYDDTGACDIQSINTPHIEADNQTYAVVNQLQSGVALTPSADSTSVSVDSDQITTDEG